MPAWVAPVSIVVAASAFRRRRRQKVVLAVAAVAPSWADDMAAQLVCGALLPFSLVKMAVNPLRRRREARLAAG
jgi:hypothetical protein